MGETDLDQFVVTFPGTLLVCHKRQRGIQTLAEQTQDMGFVKHVVRQESLWVLIQLDINLTQSIVRAWFCTPSCYTSLKPWLEHAKTITSFSNLHHFLDGTGSAHGHEDTLREVLVRPKVKQLSNHLGGFSGGNLRDINFHILKETIQVKIFCELVHKIKAITHVN